MTTVRSSSSPAPISSSSAGPWPAARSALPAVTALEMGKVASATGPRPRPAQRSGADHQGPAGRSRAACALAKTPNRPSSCSSRGRRRWLRVRLPSVAPSQPQHLTRALSARCPHPGRLCKVDGGHAGTLPLQPAPEGGHRHSGVGRRLCVSICVALRHCGLQLAAVVCSAAEVDRRGAAARRTRCPCDSKQSAARHCLLDAPLSTVVQIDIKVAKPSGRRDAGRPKTVSGSQVASLLVLLAASGTEKNFLAFPTVEKCARHSVFERHWPWRGRLYSQNHHHMWVPRQRSGQPPVAGVPPSLHLELCHRTGHTAA